MFDPINGRLYMAENADPSNSGGFVGCNLLAVTAAGYQDLPTVFFPWSFICDLAALHANPRSGVVYTASVSDAARTGLAAIGPRNDTIVGTVFAASGGAEAEWDDATGEFWIANTVAQTISIVHP